MRACGVAVACLLVASVARAGGIGSQVDGLVADGEAWDVDVAKLVAALGPPALVHVYRDIAIKLPRKTLEPQLAQGLPKLGKLKSVKQTEQSTCHDDHQCFTYEVAFANGTQQATIEMELSISEWVVASFELELPS